MREGEGGVGRETESRHGCSKDPGGGMRKRGETNREETDGMCSLHAPTALTQLGLGISFLPLGISFLPQPSRPPCTRRSLSVVGFPVVLVVLCICRFCRLSPALSLFQLFSYRLARLLGSLIPPCWPLPGLRGGTAGIAATVRNGASSCLCLLYVPASRGR